MEPFAADEGIGLGNDDNGYDASAVPGGPQRNGAK
jgi:hypothetical protein